MVVCVNVAETVLNQRRVLLNDNRKPARVLLGKMHLDALFQSEVFMVRAPYEGFAGPGRLPDDDAIGWLYGLPIYVEGDVGIRVLPDDWRGKAQGRAR